MDKKRFIGAVGLIALITLTGVGCSRGNVISKGKAKNSSGSDKVTGYVSNDDDSDKDAYKNALDLELPDRDAEALNNVLQPIVEDVLGNAKVSSFLQNFPSTESVSVEYTTKKPSEGSTLNDFIKIFKGKNYRIDQSGATDGSAFLYVTNDKYTVILNFQMGTQKVSGTIMPKTE